jgi:hypothetical protein
MGKNYLFIILLLCSFSLVSAQEKETVPSSHKVHSIAEIEDLKIYPNPITNGKAFITTKKNALKKIGIYDVFGKLVLSKDLQHKELDVSRLKKGVYIIRIAEGNRKSSRKLVIR